MKIHLVLLILGITIYRSNASKTDINSQKDEVKSNITKIEEKSFETNVDQPNDESTVDANVDIVIEESLKTPLIDLIPENSPEFDLIDGSSVGEADFYYNDVINRDPNEIMETAAGFAPLPFLKKKRKNQRPQRRYPTRRYYQNPYSYRRFQYYNPYIYGFYRPSSLPYYYYY
ncbi:unnamed protein product [Leptosia nina]|uniref:Uncharacterized protein n=1 Tax=Leptosia nina TaxID=320188 RepID=A0AAV1K3I2_9NEOP